MVIINKTLINLGIEKGYIKIFKKNKSQYTRYAQAKKEYKFDNPEERVRVGKEIRIKEFWKVC